MLARSDKTTHDIVLLGGGHAHALVLQRWAMEPLAGVALTLISPEPTTPYTGMLHGHIAGHYTRAEIEIDLVRLSRKAGARIVLDHTIAIDRAAKSVTTATGRVIAYDLLSVDIGVSAPLPDVPGAAHVHAVRPLGGFADAFASLLARTKAGDAPGVVVLGGGVGGVELIFAMDHALRAKGAAPKLTLIERGEMLKALPRRVANKLRKELARAGVEVLENTTVVEVTKTSVRLAGREIPTDFTLAATGAKPQNWLINTGLDLHKGYISVGPDLRSPTDASIFATGDCAWLSHAPRPKAGVFAVREAPVLFDNLRASVLGRPMRDYWPQRNYLQLISLGRQRALAHRAPLQLTADFLWHWKDRIDRAFMARFAPPPFPAAPDEMLCGGCGSKVGRAVLTPFMADQTGDDAAILEGGQVITTDHLRTCTGDPALMARVAAIHALGDIWAMGARPEVALAHIILPEMSAALQARRMAEIMNAAADVFAAEGIGIVGGHTTQGAELTIGFTLTGRLDGKPVRHSGARAGDVLILTKPLGAGVLLAAEARGLADGHDIAHLWAAMVKPQGRAATHLAPVAHAMTDVTGFGLAGHLAAMCKSSGTGAVIRLADLPLYPGAEALAAKALRSSIWAENFKDAAVSGPAGARFDLLFDPQTCGGLLASVPAEQAGALVTDLNALGFMAAAIGTMTDGPDITAL